MSFNSLEGEKLDLSLVWKAASFLCRYIKSGEWGWSIAHHMITKILIVQTYVVHLMVGGFIASLSNIGMLSLATVPKATSLNGLSP